MRVDGAVVDVLEVPAKGFKCLDVRGEPEVIVVRRLFSDEWGMNVGEIR